MPRLGDDGAEALHLQGSTWGCLFLETLAGSSASTLGCSFPTSFSSCRTQGETVVNWSDASLEEGDGGGPPASSPVSTAC